MPQPTNSGPAWYASKGVIGAVVTLAALVLGMFGQQQTGEVLQDEIGQVGIVWTQIVATIGAVVALVGRLVAKGPVH